MGAYERGAREEWQNDAQIQSSDQVTLSPQCPKHASVGTGTWPRSHPTPWSALS